MKTYPLWLILVKSTISMHHLIRVQFSRGLNLNFVVFIRKFGTPKGSLGYIFLKRERARMGD